MSNVKRHRFQSSREVFGEYIPGYNAGACGGVKSDSENEAIQSGLELAEGLVNKFRKSITKTQKK